MKKVERILLIIFVISFGLQFLDFSGKKALLIITSSILSSFYLIGCYWLYEKKIKIVISIFAGIAFSSSLIIFPYSTWLNKPNYFEYLLISNIILSVILIIYAIAKRKFKDKIQSIKPIIVRSFVILIFTAFFIYSPMSFNIYRNVVYALNIGNEYTRNNIQMFGYREKSLKALDNGNCNRAIEYAEKANKAGLKWLDIDFNEDSCYSENSVLWNISGTFEMLYKVYNSKAEKLSDQKEHTQALDYYLKSYKSLTHFKYESEYWKTEIAHSINQLALCYLALENYEKSDSLFTEAIDRYYKAKGELNENLAIFYSNLAQSMQEQGEYGYSNTLLNISNSILQADSINLEDNESLFRNYRSLIVNYFMTDSINKAIIYIEKTFENIEKVDKDYCKNNLYYGVSLFKLNKFFKADSVLMNNLELSKEIYNPFHQNIAENHIAIAKVKLALAQYKLAKTHLEQGLEITIKNFGENSDRYANFIRHIAYIDFSTGNYKESEAKYKKVAKIYENVFGERNYKMPEVLAGLAETEIALAKFKKAKLHADNSLSVLLEFDELNQPKVTELLNSTAYVNYCNDLFIIADSLYNKTLEINENYNQSHSVSTAVALNGLGLIMTSNNNYNKADSLFTKSLKLHRDLLTENHPLTAIVYLNYANLNFQRNNIEEAKRMLNLSLEINEKFYDSGHDIYADIYTLFGDISAEERELEQAVEFYQKALSIYLNIFEEDHVKVLILKEKLELLANNMS